MVVAVYLSVFVSVHKKCNDTFLITGIENRCTVSPPVSYLTSGTVHLQVTRASEEERDKRKKEQMSQPNYIHDEAGLMNALKKQKKNM